MSTKKKSAEMVVEVTEAPGEMTAEVTESMLPEEPVLTDADLAPVAEAATAAPVAAPVAPPARQPSEFVNRMVAWLASRNVEKAEARDMGDRTWCITALFGGALDFPEGAEIIRSELAPAYVRSFAIETPMMSRVVAETVEGVERLRIEFLAVELV